MCIYSPMPHTLSYCALIGKCALIRSNTVIVFEVAEVTYYKVVKDLKVTWQTVQIQSDYSFMRRNLIWVYPKVLKYWDT